MSQTQWHYRRGELAKDGLDLHLDAVRPPLQPWKHTGIRVGDAASGIALPADQNERIILIAAGEKVDVHYTLENGDTSSVQLLGRIDVFHGPADVLYLPFNTSGTVTGNARVIIGEAPARNIKPVQVMRKAEVPIYLRGAGRETRQIHNFCMPDTLDADRFICVEGIVPSGNWSGVPAHKHDVSIPGKESHLEEIYYFETAPARGTSPSDETEPFGYFRGYASDDREFHVDGAIHHQDLVAIPHGYHGPVSAAPGYDLYFFNVMAGPEEKREWLVTDDPCHAWIRETWEGQASDPRLPYLEK